MLLWATVSEINMIENDVTMNYTMKMTVKWKVEVGSNKPENLPWHRKLRREGVMDEVSSKFRVKLRCG